MKLIPLAVICMTGIASFATFVGVSTVDTAIIAMMVSAFFILRFVAFGNISISEWHEKQSHPTTQIQKFIHVIYPFDVIICYGIIMILIAK